MTRRSRVTGSGSMFRAELRRPDRRRRGRARVCRHASASRRCSRRPTPSTGSRTCRAGRRAPDPAARRVRSCRCGRRRPTGRAPSGSARAWRCTTSAGASGVAGAGRACAGCRVQERVFLLEDALDQQRRRRCCSSLVDLGEHGCRGGDEVPRVVAFGEPAVDRREHGARLVAPAVASEQRGEIRSRRAARTTSPAARWRARWPGAGSLRRRRDCPPSAAALRARDAARRDSRPRASSRRARSPRRRRAGLRRCGPRRRASRRAARERPCARGRIRSPAARRGCPSAARCLRSCCRAPRARRPGTSGPIRFPASARTRARARRSRRPCCTASSASPR